MAGSYLIVDLTQEPPAVVSADAVLPAAIIAKLNEIKELIMSTAAAGQAQIQTLADGMTSVTVQLTSASTNLANWIAQHQDAPLDFTPALNALASIQAAGSVVDGLTPQDPVASAPPLPDPVPAPPDPATDPGTPITDPGTPDLVDPGYSIDVGTATDPTTTPSDGSTTGLGDAGGATDSLTTDTGSGIPPS